jgi:hypothetical protein
VKGQQRKNSVQELKTKTQFTISASKTKPTMTLGNYPTEICTSAFSQSDSQVKCRNEAHPAGL